MRAPDKWESARFQAFCVAWSGSVKLALSRRIESILFVSIGRDLAMREGGCVQWDGRH